MHAEAKQNRLIKQTLYFDGLPNAFEDYKVFFISDLHRREISAALLAEVQPCDIVIIGGDLLENGVPADQIKKNLRSLAACGPCYFVWGNNDVEIDEHVLREMLKETGVQELNNSCEILSQDGQSILLAGGSEPIQQGLYDGMIEQAKHYSFSLFVCHFPLAFKQLPQNHPFSFLLGGHTHGGQIRLFGLSVAKLGSLRKVNHAIQLISNGYGTSKLPLRLGALPETHLFTLKSGSTAAKSPSIHHFKS